MSGEQEKATELMKKLYKFYGTDSGWLFGLGPAQRKAVRGVVIAILRIQEEER